jgi:tripartite-type tricarboxylate transporter receptor subunit TctC
MKEAGYPQVGFNPDVWQAIVAPAGTPAPVIAKLNAAINEVLKSPETQKALARRRFDPLIKSPQEFAAFLAEQARIWPPIIKTVGLKAP